ncbi:MAG: PEP-utilizing enzyme [Myxococcales bacterium]
MADLKAVVRKRRAEYSQNKAFQPPAVVVGRFDPRRHLLPPPPSTKVLKGVSVSPGVAEGPARVLLTADSEERVLPGEILVAPFTDPGWTPYFLPAAAIVMDMGGVLSHGSVLAREYGIPAVVNVGPATRVLRTGQRVRVDAFRGEVQVLD